MNSPGLSAINKILDYIRQHEQELSDLAREELKTHGHGALCIRLDELPDPTLCYLSLDDILPGGRHAHEGLAQACNHYTPEQEFVFVALEQTPEGVYSYLPLKRRFNSH